MCESVVSYILANVANIEEDVRSYFSQTVHKGVGSHLKFVQLELEGMNDNPPTVSRIIAHPSIDRLVEKDTQFDTGLANIGQKYLTTIVLPEKLYKG